MGCDDEPAGTVTDASAEHPTDAGSVDAGAPDAGAPASFYGRPCTSDGECAVGGFCLGEIDDWPARGYCTRSCTADEDCGDGAFCSDGPNRLCFAECSSDGTCADDNHMCASVFGGGATDLGRPGCVPGKPVAESVACTSFGDCRPTQACARDPWILPGGACTTVTCIVGDDSSCAPPDGHCYDFGGGPTCIDACVSDSDCREGEGYRCYDSQVPEIGKYCAFLTQTGAACADSADCGPTPWECVDSADLPGGYCGATGCDPTDPLDPTLCNARDSRCHDPSSLVLGDEFCVRTCTVATEAIDCRTAEGYTCQDLDGDGPGLELGCLH